MHHLHIFTAGQVSIITFGVHRGINAWKQIQTEILFRLMTHDLSREFVLFHIRWADKQAQQTPSPPLRQSLVVSGLSERSCLGGATGSPEPQV